MPPSGTEHIIAIERDFIAGPFGQVHVRIAKPETASDKPPLILFHPTPYSGDYFTRLMQIMARDRVVIAIDTPGYGDSDRPENLPSIADYARSAAVALDTLGYNSENRQQIDVLGYHTGCLIAAELAITHPDMVRRVILPGLPFYTGEERQAAYARNAVPDPLMRDGSHLIKKWAFSTGASDVGLSLQRGQEHFNDGIQCYPHCWEAYHAVFTYESEKRFRKVFQPVLLITNDGSLRTETEAALPFFRNANIKHLDKVTLGGFDLAADRYAKMIRSFLDERTE